MEYYQFATFWRINSPLPAVWDLIYHSEHWPEWWRGLESVVELDKGDENGLGNLRRYTWKGALPYRLTFDIRTTRIQLQVLIEGVSSGDLDGTGIWRFSREGDLTVVRYDWRVQTAKRWMNALVPVARPLFRWNHDKIMEWGRKGLVKRLGNGVQCMASASIKT